MSDPEKKKSVTANAGSMIMVEKTTSGRHHKPCPSNELSEATELHLKHSKAPAAISVSEALKNVAENSTVNETSAIEQQKDTVHDISSDKHKHSVAKNLSSSTNKRELSPELIALATLEKDKKSTIPLDLNTDVIKKDKPTEKKTLKKDDTDSITEEITELHVPEVAAEHSEWSYDEGAGGLPRSESRASRVSHAVRQFFCCGVTYEAPSEDTNMQSPGMKKTSWNEEYEQNIILQEITLRNEAWMLDRKASVGPCYRPGLPSEGPSGIMINLPKKSLKSLQPSGISINISRKCSRTQSKSITNELQSAILKSEMGESKIATWLNNFTDKLFNVQDKIKHFFE